MPDEKEWLKLLGWSEYTHREAIYYTHPAHPGLDYSRCGAISQARADVRDAAEECFLVCLRIVEWMDDNGYAPEDQSFGARAAIQKARGESHAR